MLRRLLACLALLTGLAAAGAPAQAELVNALAARVEVSAAVSPAVGSAATASAAALSHRFHRAPPRIAIGSCDRRGAAVTVRLGCDRARE